ncbi:peptide-methionine (S)-S-oxide reductase MsrA [Pseudoalteromonas sp. McH1-7]|uniref:peptide-methionine (S)-S-oxide reductase MsrA n=2 Tax=unclassified Pseudoalteromonas TaxID=194690 RepID=UPI001590F425|nr:MULTISPECIES: peptide-methionine (S)-S-oxide reductase MsrA [unclassified Pseudoalteromonas]NUZ09164.1 peptide-methionine (S)-S-oxide reductase MsrA [Pseudoalteromonas sp. McH1-7]USD29951.1 peptide-methionine (S)-S-oxide reductase MsrA [Pseudoalteromonas sp. SCSIO 43201]
MKMVYLAMAAGGLILAGSAITATAGTGMPEPKVDGASNHIKTLVLGSGCFWGPEKRYEKMTGVIDAESGYADGKGFTPTYKEIIKASRRFDENNYAEVVKVTYNANLLTTEALLKSYFESHDPTQSNRQGNDVGTQYRSIILYSDTQQGDTAEALKVQFQQRLSNAGFGKIQTSIKPLRKFYPAEEYHQNYLAKNPNGYCPDHSTGVTFEKAEKAEVDNSLLLTGKHIVIIDSRSYCPYCEKLKKEVINDYQGDIPLHFRFADQLQGLTIKTATWATPTILFTENGKESYGFQGYMKRSDFYKVLGAFKLGRSEAFNIAFQKGTERPFCKQYDIFKNTPDGVFVDKLSGKALFDTRDRFNSGTGWLSFTHPVEGSVTYHEDFSHAMVRTEIRSKSSGIHLGHVFKNEGPKGEDRYCINAQVLEFKLRDKFSE